LPGRTAPQAVGRFLDTLQLALSTVTTTKLVASPGGHQTLGREHALTTSSGEPILLRCVSRQRLQLSLAWQYEIIRRPDAEPKERFKVSTRWYQHHVLTADDGEVALFHWHPVTGHGPHVHIGALGSSGLLTSRSHVPSGRVPIEAVLRFLLTELNVKPARDDWAPVLDQCEQDFRRFASWLGHPTLDAGAPPPTGR
jgi:hypothetical protein